MDLFVPSGRDKNAGDREVDRATHGGVWPMSDGANNGRSPLAWGAGELGGPLRKIAAGNPAAIHILDSLVCTAAQLHATHARCWAGAGLAHRRARQKAAARATRKCTGQF